MSAVGSDIREIWSETFEYRELLLQMTLRDLLLRYKQTIMGFAWAVFMPLLNTALFSVIFTRVASIETPVPYPVFAYCGLWVWNFHASSLRFAVTSLTSNANLVTKVYFPREIFPISSVIVCFVDFAVGATVLIALMWWYGIEPTVHLAWLPVVMVIQIAFTSALALIVSMANLFYRDVKYLFEVVITMWMFFSSVIYPVNQVSGVVGAVLRWNPMTPIIDAYRGTLLLGQAPSVAFFVVAVLSALLLCTAWLVFHRAEFRFAESI